MRVTIKQKSAQEKKLDEIQKALAQVLRQVENQITSYRSQDVKALRAAYIALDKVTLLTDKELEDLLS